MGSLESAQSELSARIDSEVSDITAMVTTAAAESSTSLARTIVDLETNHRETTARLMGSLESAQSELSTRIEKEVSGLSATLKSTAAQAADAVTQAVADVETQLEAQSVVLTGQVDTLRTDLTGELPILIQPS